MEITVASKTDTGRVRSENQDAILTDPPLVAVADGMGGHRGGRQAATLALEVVASYKERFASDGDTAGTLREAMHEANRAVLQRGTEDPELEGMGTTLIAVWLDGAKLTLGHVGDSRAYLLRNSELRQLTEDQTVAQEWVRQGRIRADEADSSPQRHILIQSIGTTENLDVSLVELDLEAGDRLVLASDGLFGMVRPSDDLRDILLANGDPARACDALVEAANAAGGSDNISVILVDIGERPAPGTIPPPAPAEPKRRARVPLVVGSLVLVAAVGIGVWFVSMSRPSYVVATRHGAVVLLDGSAGDDGAMATGEVVRIYREERLDSFSEPTRRDLRSGIDVPSPEDADRIVGNLPRVLGPADTPAPSLEPPDTPVPTTTLER